MTGAPVAQGILPDGRLQRTAVVGSLTDELPDIVRADAFFRLAEQYGQGVQRPTARVGLVASVDLAESLFQTVQIVDLAPVYPVEQRLDTAAGRDQAGQIDPLPERRIRPASAIPSPSSPAR